MGKKRKRFVARAEHLKGWGIWDNKKRRWWGERYKDLPEQLLEELNGAKIPERLVALVRVLPKVRVK